AFLGFSATIRLIDHIHIVETEIWHTELGEQLKRCVHLISGTLKSIGFGIPGISFGSGSKRIMAHVAEGMPVANSKLEVFLHGLACHHTIFVIVTECHRVIGINALKGYFVDAGKKFFIACDNAHNVSPVLDSKKPNHWNDWSYCHFDQKDNTMNNARKEN
ncbi:MAG: hypothetical protein RLN85_10000, partial [Pseudomonadales bacterium]